MTTILHVEDNVELADVVEAAFAAFGFHGVHLKASTVREARELLSDVAHHERIDLVMSDMHLGDGSGLDVIREVRSNPARAHVPILILSGDVDCDDINRAYALGANAYVPKGTFARPIGEVVKALQQHWLDDVQLPTPSNLGRTRLWIGREVSVLTLAVQHCLNNAEQFGASGSAEASPWLQVALRAGNMANLLAFLLSQIGDDELPGELLDEVEGRQLDIVRKLGASERTPAKTRDEALADLAVVLSTLDTAPFTRAVSMLFPASPIAIVAMCEVGAAGLDELAAWIEANASHPDLRAQIARLRGGASVLRSSSERARRS